MSSTVCLSVWGFTHKILTKCACKRFYSCMITLTERAAEHIILLTKEKAADKQVLRLFIEAGGCSGLEYGMSFDVPNPDDHVLEDKGIQFVMDPTSLEYMQGSEIDFDDGLNGKGFDIKNPNASSTCGCGRSFN